LDEFWDLSPRETDAIIEAFFEREDVLNQRFGTVAAAAWNAHRATAKKKSWLSWRDYFKPLARQNQKRGLSREEIMAQVNDMRRQFYPKG
jgi:hypothetical protein